ncbi:MAG: hypothetical protein Q7R41_04600, partial [Phycisphaerales bacterium]|nr:hypothetical protein [Phycisphaerales bacterium]
MRHYPIAVIPNWISPATVEVAKIVIFRAVADSGNVNNFSVWSAHVVMSGSLVLAAVEHASKP